jgi:hypothetical protein
LPQDQGPPCTARSHGGIVAFGAATLTANIRKLVLYEGWPVPDPTVYALPPRLKERMDELLDLGDRDGVVPEGAGLVNCGFRFSFPGGWLSSGVLILPSVVAVGWGCSRGALPGSRRHV